MATKTYIGIDLGTTNSCVAVFKNNKVDVIANEIGSRTTPSCVTFTKDFILTGPEAVNQAHLYPSTFIFEVKRLIGQNFENDKVQEDIKRFPFPVFNDLGCPKIRIDLKNEQTREYYPEEISAYVLQRMRKIAERYMKEAISGAVVTVPAHFNDAQRQATKDAATIAGFTFVKIINEPTAAALAFTHEHIDNHNRNILVYDFGGGTFDVSIVNVEGSICKVVATRGDLHLGGSDIDAAITKYLKEDYTAQFNRELDCSVAKIARRLKNKSTTAKETLSGDGQYQVAIEMDELSGEDYTTNITRIQIERLSASIFDATMKCVKECLEECNLKASDIAEVILVGGSSRIPKIQALIKGYFGAEKINQTVNADEAVAYGAAIYAANLARSDKTECISLLDVTSFSIGTDVEDDQMNFIIRKNATLPAKAIKKYATVYDNQTTMDFPIYQGESDMASDNVLLGKFTMTGLTEAAKGQVRVEICCNIDIEGILNVSATETNESNNTKNVVIDIKKFGLGREKIEERSREANINEGRLKDYEQFLEAQYKRESSLECNSKTCIENNDTFQTDLESH